MSESRILADFTDYADLRSSVYLTPFVVLSLPISPKPFFIVSIAKSKNGKCAEAVQKAQDFARASNEAYFDERVKTLIELSTALHKILRDEQES